MALWGLAAGGIVIPVTPAKLAGLFQAADPSLG